MTGICCPSCASSDHRIAESRSVGQALRRRRHCVCGNRFTTVEVIVTTKVAPYRLSTAGRFQ